MFVTFGSFQQHARDLPCNDNDWPAAETEKKWKRNWWLLFLLVRFRALEVFKDYGRRLSEIIEEQREQPGKSKHQGSISVAATSH